MPPLVNDQAPVPLPTYYRMEVRRGRALHIDHLTLVRSLHLLTLCCLAVRVAHSRCLTPLPAGPGGLPRCYSEESLSSATTPPVLSVRYQAAVSLYAPASPLPAIYQANVHQVQTGLLLVEAEELEIVAEAEEPVVVAEAKYSPTGLVEKHLRLTQAPERVDFPGFVCRSLGGRFLSQYMSFSRWPESREGAQAVRSQVPVLPSKSSPRMLSIGLSPCFSHRLLPFR